MTSPTPTPADLEALALRCEREGASRELDILIAVTAGGWVHQPNVAHNFKWKDSTGFDVPGPPLNYTSSIDAAMTLVPDKLPDHSEIVISLEGNRSVATVVIQTRGMYEGEETIIADASALTIPQALCAASLRERAATAKGNKVMARTIPEIIAHIRAVVANAGIRTTLIQTEDLEVICDAAERYFEITNAATNKQRDGK